MDAAELPAGVAARRQRDKRGEHNAIGGGEPFSVPISGTHAARVVRWSPDARALAYIDGAGGASNIWVKTL